MVGGEKRAGGGGVLDVGLAEPVAPGGGAQDRGVEVIARDLATSRGGRPVLHGVSFEVAPGELVGIVGGSGAGKTTLLEAVAGVRPAERGQVLFDGADLYANFDAFRVALGYVPQDDIIHAELPLERTLRYAASLRLPRGEDAVAAARKAMAALDLSERAGVRVRDLSGGQRKRASIAVELLTDPHVFFLDEPTSGLDPATGADLVGVLRRLADRGSTVVFTTHAPPDLVHCDRIVVLAREGYLAFVGSTADARRYFGVERTEEIYVRLEHDGTPQEWARRFAAQGNGSEPTRLEQAAPTGPSSRVERAAPRGASSGARRGASFARQWSVLSRRTFETLARNPLTVAILLGSPAMVVALFVVLFRAGAFDFRHPSPSAVTMILFWITFGAFFFGITYGLLQICTERAILRREHLVGQRLSAYLLSKLTVLLPFLLVVVVLMLAVLRAVGRLPPVSTTTYALLGVTLLLEAVAALTLGLWISAAVTNPSQATLALPMACFPAVLFSGAILPVHVMAGVGAAISTVVPVRWAFEGIGHILGVRSLLLHGSSPLGPPLVRAYGNAGQGVTATYWLYLAIFIVVFFAGAWATLARTCRRQAA